MTGRTREASRGISEGLGGHGGPQARDPRREGAGGIHGGLGDTCPCVRCGWVTDCDDDFYCPGFEAWFTARGWRGGGEGS